METNDDIYMDFHDIRDIATLLLLHASKVYRIGWGFFFRRVFPSIDRHLFTPTATHIMCSK